MQPNLTTCLVASTINKAINQHEVVQMEILSGCTVTTDTLDNGSSSDNNNNNNNNTN